jgi:leucyl-tRNA synthetase
VTQTTFDDTPPEDAALLSILHSQIRKVTRDIEDLHYNTAISALMELLTVLHDQPRHHRHGARVLLQMLSPFAPFMAQELWARLAESGMVHTAPWPAFDESLIRADEVEIVVQVDGKRRGTIRLPSGASQEEVEQAARTSRAAQPSLRDRQVVRTIFVPDRLINLVTRSTASR